MKEITKQRIREILETSVADGTTAGANVLVMEDGKEVYYTQHGFADIGQKKPIERDTIFRLYSMTKPVTAAAVMILMERGLLDLGQPVADLLPGFQNLSVEKDGKIVPCSEETPLTVLHLLNMTSGLSYGDDQTVAGRCIADYLDECVARMHTDHAVTTVEFANHIGTFPLAFEPGSSWRYGLSADILGAVVEVVSGQTFGEFMKENIFEPLHMDDTAFWVPEEKQNRLAKVYETVGQGKMELYTGEHLVISNRMEKSPAYEAGGAGLVSTIDDYARFAQMLLNGGSLDGKEILQPETVKFMRTGGLTARQQESFWNIQLDGFTYSHLMRIMAQAGRSVGLARLGEYGWDGWLGCYFANFPEENRCILMMQQKKDSGTIPMTRKIRNVILAEK